MDTNVLVAANVRARMAWHRLPQARLKDELGWSQRTIQNKLGAVTGITSAELVKLAKLFELPDPGPLYRVPEGFSPELSSRPDNVRDLPWVTDTQPLVETAA